MEYKGYEVLGVANATIDYRLGQRRGQQTIQYLNTNVKTGIKYRVDTWAYDLLFDNVEDARQAIDEFVSK